ncbi:MtN3/saliva-related transmembrane protein, conserved region [Pseudodesulfovibrio mercurii]|uniref:MtN3/saliva-related transmembrane protein, conserved region n=1 Tax=Pseudodesulfovibrio mercurii TaxID=641491 RepID=F0JBG9_9BACT|nr:SemiSWEET transporter [Pseudodesulfovibrio mercurii]EGB14288.1 MtN3/saliva-related transmembrane protein, conserved region [Pseudodesulfovibrio mercurii]
MRMDILELLGLLAGCCTTAAFFPQVLHTWRTRSVADLSLRMYLLMTVGVFLWLVYGLFIGSLAVTLANSVTLVLAASILVMKLVYGRPSARDFDHRPK